MPIIEAIEAVQSDKPSNDETLSNAIAAKLNSKDRFSFDEMLTALKIQKDEKGKIGAQNQTQFEYVQQRIFETTGQTWKWEGTPKDGKWIKVSNANIADPTVENPLPTEALSDAIAATDTLFLNKKQLCERLGLNYKNLSTNAGKQNMTADAFMLHTAKQQGEIWEKSKSKGREALWKLVETFAP